MPLAEYTGQIPFATLADMVPVGDYSFNNYMDVNTIKTDSDWLAPTIITLHENATITLDNGQQFQGGIIVDYYETMSPLIAGRLAREHVIRSKWSIHHTQLDITDLGLITPMPIKNSFPLLFCSRVARWPELRFINFPEIIPCHWTIGGYLRRQSQRTRALDGHFGYFRV